MRMEAHEGEVGGADVSGGKAVSGVKAAPVVSSGSAGMTKADAAKLNKRARTLHDRIEKTYIDLADVLFEIYDGAAYMPLGYKSFKEWAEQELGVKLRKALYLVDIAKWLKTLPDDARSWAEKLGWSKAKELTGRVTKDNFEEWRAKVEGKSVAEVQALLAGSKGEVGADDDTGSDSKSSSGDDGSSVRKMSFSLQKEQDKIVTDAISKAKQIAGTDKDGSALEMMATDFLATNNALDTVGDYLGHVEKITGLKLIAVDPSGDDGNGSIVFGGDTLDSLVEEE